MRENGFLAPREAREGGGELEEPPSHAGGAAYRSPPLGVELLGRVRRLASELLLLDDLDKGDGSGWARATIQIQSILTSGAPG